MRQFNKEVCLLCNKTVAVTEETIYGATLTPNTEPSMLTLNAKSPASLRTERMMAHRNSTVLCLKKFFYCQIKSPVFQKVQFCSQVYASQVKKNVP